SLALCITIVRLALSVYPAYVSAEGLCPSEDTGVINASTEAATDISAPALMALQTRIAAIVKAYKAVDYISCSSGASVGSDLTSNTGRISIALKPRAERNESATQVIQRLRASANTVPGISAIFTPVQ